MTKLIANAGFGVDGVRIDGRRVSGSLNRVSLLASTALVGIGVIATPAMAQTTIATPAQGGTITAGSASGATVTNQTNVTSASSGGLTIVLSDAQRPTAINGVTIDNETGGPNTDALSLSSTTATVSARFNGANSLTAAANGGAALSISSNANSFNYFNAAGSSLTGSYGVKIAVGGGGTLDARGDLGQGSFNQTFTGNGTAVAGVNVTSNGGFSVYLAGSTIQNFATGINVVAGGATVDMTGGSITATNTGIRADGGAGAAIVTSQAAIVAPTGIYAAGSGGVSVTTSGGGTIDSTSAGTGTGIQVSASGTGNVTVAAGAAIGITNAFQTGIDARSTGSGTVSVSNSAAINATGPGIYGSSAATTGNAINANANVTGTGLAAIQAVGQGFTVTIGNGATVTGSGANSRTIIVQSGDGSVVNNGTIQNNSANANSAIQFGQAGTLVNNGTISYAGNQLGAIYANTGLTITNSGSITSTGTPVAIYSNGSGTFATSVTNLSGGSINGTILLANSGTGANTLDLRSGSTTGAISSLAGGTTTTTLAGTLTGGYSGGSATGVANFTLASTGSMQGATFGSAGDTFNWQGGSIGGVINGGGGTDTFNAALGAGNSATLNQSNVTGFENYNLTSGTMTLSGSRTSGSGWQITSGASVNLTGTLSFNSGTAGFQVNGNTGLSTVGIASTGQLTGYIGVYYNAGAQHNFSNAGTITATLDGIFANFFGTGTNSGTITATNSAAVYLAQGSSIFTNSGTITGGNDATTGYGFYGSNGSLTLTNTAGKISGGTGGVAQGSVSGGTNYGGLLSLTNASGAEVSGPTAIATLGSSSLNLTNAGNVVGTANAINATGTGVVNITNNAGGTIGTGTVTGGVFTAGGTGDAIDLGGSAANKIDNSGTVTGAVAGIAQTIGATGTLAVVNRNGGTVTGATNDGITARGVLTGVNAMGGTISSTTNSGITVVGAATVTNGGALIGGNSGQYGYGFQNASAGAVTFNNFGSSTGSQGGYVALSSGAASINLFAGSTTGAIFGGSGNDTLSIYTGTGTGNLGTTYTTTTNTLAAGTTSDATHVLVQNAGTLAAASFGAVDLGGGTNTIALRGTGDGTAANGATGTYNIGSIATADVLTKADSGTWTLTGAGVSALTINAGTGAVPGSGGLLIFNGTSGLTGAITVNGATIRATTAGGFGTGTITTIDPTVQFAATGTYANPIVLSSTNTAADPTRLEVGNGLTATLSGTISESPAPQPLVFGLISGAASGTFVLTNTANSWTGTTTIETGTTLQGATNTISGGSVANAGTLVFSQAVDGSFAKNISGAGAIQINAPTHAITLSGTNTNSGLTSIVAGTLIASGGSAIGDASTVDVASGTEFQLANSETVGGLSGAGTTRVLGNTLTVGGNNASTTFSGGITDQTAVAYIGSWTVSDGPAWATNPPTYTGQDAAALLFGGTASNYRISTAGPSTATITDTAWYNTYGANPTDYVQASATYRVDTGSAGYNISGDTSAYVQDHSGNPHTNYAFTGGLALGGGLTKTGTGTLILSGTNNYTGVTTILGGALDLRNGAAIADSGTVIVTSPGTLLVTNSETIGTLNGNGAASLTGTLTLANGSGAYTGNATGGGLVLSGGNWTFGGTRSGANADSGYGSGVLVSGTGSNLTIASTGTITGGSFIGVRVTGQGASVTNLGSITNTGTGGAESVGAGVAIYTVGGANTVTNGSVSNTTATISGQNNAINQRGGATAALTVNNFGTLVSNLYNAIEDSGSAGTLTINNTGSAATIVGRGTAGQGRAISHGAASVLTVVNSGRMIGGTEGIFSNGAVNITNSGTIGSGTLSGITTGIYTANSGNGITANGGGTIANNLGGSIAGGVGIASAAALTLTNSGTITGNNAVFAGVNATGAATKISNAGAISGGAQAIVLNSGGSVFNAAAGTLSTTNAAALNDASGIYSAGALSLVNLGAISTANTGNSYGVEVIGAGTIVNGGTISAASKAGVSVSAGGTVTNAVGGTLQGGNNATLGYGIAQTGGAINNYGTIKGAGAGNGLGISGGNTALAINLYAGSNTGSITTGSGADTLTLYSGQVNTTAVTTTVTDPISGATTPVTLQAAGSLAAATVGAINLGTGNNTLVLRGPGDGAANGASGSLSLNTVTGLTNLNKIDTGTWTLTGASASPTATINAGNGTPSGLLVFSGTTGLTGVINVNGATIRAASAGAFGTGTINAIDPTIQYGATGIYANNIVLNSVDTVGDPTRLQADNGVNATLTGNITQATAGQPVVINVAGSTGTITLTGANTYTGATTVAGGTLAVNGSNLSATNVSAGGNLTGSGSVGATAIADGGTLTGAQGSTLTMASLGLSSGSIVNATFGAAGGNTLFAVAGNLTLDGTVNVADTGAFGFGVYRLFNYGGTLTDNTLVVGTKPVDAQRVIVQTSVAGQVNIISAPDQLLFWDGGNPALYNNGAVNGGSGIWSVTAPNWTDASGLYDDVMTPQPGFAIFQASGGTVTVDNSAGAVSVTGMQFASDGYVVTGGAIGLAAPTTTIRVGDGTAAGAAFVTTIDSALTGASGLQKTDLGTLILSGANNWTGTTTISAGTLQGNSASISGGNIVDNGTLVYVQPGSGTVAQDISGSGAVRISGLAAGETLTFSGTNSVSGGFTVTDTSAIANTGSISGMVALTGGGTFTNSGTANYLTNSGAVAGAINNSGTLTGGVFNTGALTVTNAASGSIGNGVSSTGAATSVTVVNAGSVTSGGSAIYVTAGTLNVTNLTGGSIATTGGNGIYSQGGAVTIANSGNIAGNATYTGIYLTGTAAVSIVNNASGTISGYDGVLFRNGTLENSGTITGLTNNGVSALNVATVDNLAGGVINATAAGGWGIYSQGATLTATNAGTINAESGIVKVTGTGTFGNSGTINAALNGVLTLSAGTLAVTNTGTIASNVNGVQFAAGGSVINDAGSISGGTNGILSSGGALSVTNNAVLSGGTFAISSTGTFADTVVLGAASTTTGNVDLGAGNDSLTLNAGETHSGTLDGGADVDALILTGVGNGGLDIGSVINFESRTKNGTGTFTLTGIDASPVAWTINDGVLSASGGSAINDAAAVTVNAPGTLNLANNETIGSLTGAGNVTLGANTLFTGADGTATTFSGVISGNGGLTKVGTGTFTLSGANTYAGTTFVNAGTLALGASDVIADNSFTFVNTGAILDLGANSDTVGYLYLLGTLNGSGTLTTGQYQLDGATVNANLGTGTLVVAGTGVSTLNGTSAASFVDVSSGTLSLGASDRLDDTAYVLVEPGSTLDLQGFSDTVGNLGLQGTLNGTGTLTAATYALDSATVNANLGTGLLSQNSGISTLNGTSAANTVYINGGTLALGASDRLSDTAQVGVFGSAALDIGAFNDTVGTLTLAGTLNGTGTLTAAEYDLVGGTVNANLGAGNLFQLSGSSILNGTAGAANVSVQGGTLTLGASDRLADNATVSVASGSVLDLAANNDTVGLLSLSGNLNGTGTLTAAEYDLSGGTANANLGAGNLFQLSGSSILNGTAASANVAVQGGTLTLGASDRLADTATVSVVSGSTLNLGTNSDTIGLLMLNGVLNGTGALTAAQYQLNGATVNANLGAGTLFQLGGTSILNGTAAATPVTINAGTLVLGASDRLSDSATVSVASGAILNLQNFSDTVGLLQLNGTLGGSGTLTAAQYQLNGATVNANIGAGTLFQLGGTSVLNGSALATPVMINGGTLLLGASNRLSDTATVSIANGAVLDLGANSDTVGLLQSSGTLNGTGTLTAAQYQLTGATVNGNLGTGTLFQLGGTSVLSGAASVATVAVNAGTLKLGASNRIADGALVNVASGATFDLASFNDSVGQLTGAGTVALGSGALTVGGTNADFGFNGATTGTGDLNKVGTGTFTYLGTAATTARLNANAGNLLFAGTSSGSARVQGGILSGGGTFAGNLLLASGTLSPGMAGQAIAGFNVGSFTATGGTYAVDFAGITGSFASDQIFSAGALTLSGGTVTPSAVAASSNYNANQEYLILKGSSLSGTFSNGSTFGQVSGSPDLYWRLRYDLSTSGVVLEIRKTIDYVTGLGSGATANQIAVATSLNGSVLAGSDAWAGVLNAIGALSASDRVKAYDSIGGESLADITTSVELQGNRFTDLLRSRFTNGGGVNNGNIGGAVAIIDGTAPKGVIRAAQPIERGSSSLTGKGKGVNAWIQGFGADGSIGGRSGTAKLNDFAAGVAVGLEVKTDTLTIGAAGAVSDVEGNVRAFNASNKSTLYQGGLYIAYDDGATYANASGSYFSGSVNTARTVSVGTNIVGKAIGRANTDGFAGGATLGHRIGLGGNLFFTPQVGADVVSVNRDAFVETGAGALSLSVNREKRTLYSGLAEGRLSYRGITASGGVVEPYVSAGVRVNFGDLDTLSSMRFTGAPTGTGSFTIAGARMPKTSALVTAGINANPTDNVQIGVDVGGSFGDKQQEGRVGLHVKIGF